MREPGRRAITAGGTLLGAGLGAILVAMANGIARAKGDAPKSDPRMRHYQDAAIGFGVAGAVITSTAIPLLVWGLVKRHRARAAAASPTPNGSSMQSDSQVDSQPTSMPETFGESPRGLGYMVAVDPRVPNMEAADMADIFGEKFGWSDEDKAEFIEGYNKAVADQGKSPSSEAPPPAKQAPKQAPPRGRRGRR